MEKLDQIIQELALENMLTLEDIPRLDLYMDQVIQLFESKFADAKRNDEEKVLTKTMINNYAKGKLLFPIKNKKYSPEHLLMISLIYQLKGALSIHDIKVTLDGINEKIIAGNFQIDSFYNSYLHLISANVGNFKNDINLHAREVTSEISHLDEEDSENLEQILMIMTLVHMSNLYRRVAEKLVDDMVNNRNKKE